VRSVGRNKRVGNNELRASSTAPPSYYKPDKTSVACHSHTLRRASEFPTPAYVITLAGEMHRFGHTGGLGLGRGSGDLPLLLSARACVSCKRRQYKYGDRTNERDASQSPQHSLNLHVECHVKAVITSTNIGTYDSEACRITDYQMYRIFRVAKLPKSSALAKYPSNPPEPIKRLSLVLVYRIHHDLVPLPVMSGALASTSPCGLAYPPSGMGTPSTFLTAFPSKNII
jgi:hypothetical protein